MQVLMIDELNKLYDGEYNRRSVPYEEYFSEMDISKEEREKRIDFSEKFEEVMMFLFYMLAMSEQYGYNNVEYIKSQVVKKYEDVAKEYMSLDEYTNEYIRQFASETMEVTLRNSNDVYYTSQDRAMLIAENEANTILNYSQFIDAIEKGYTRKEWVAENDEKVRETHVRADNTIVGIEDAFLVGDSMLLFPKDTSYGASAEEIVNCRCTIKFHK